MSPSWKLRGYVLHELLGSGASAEVWRASVSDTGEQVALKRVPIIGPEHLARVHEEAAILSALDHPHLVRLHAVVPDGDAVVLVLDLADGGSLADLLHARGRLTPGEVITAVAPVAAALACVHAAGVVHGDVSPANVLFTRGGVAMLADLGVARLGGDERDAESTPAYVDPAVAAGCVPGPQSDVFMLGGVALHALTGMPPWAGTSSDDALDLARRGVLPDLEALLDRAGVDEAMVRVLRRSLAVLPHARGTAADFALDLRHSGRPVAVELTAGRERPTAQPWAPRRSRPMFTGPSASAPREDVAGPRPAHRPRHAASVLPAARAGGQGSLFRSASVRRHEAAVLDPARPTFERPGRAGATSGGAPGRRRGAGDLAKADVAGSGPVEADVRVAGGGDGPVRGDDPAPPPTRAVARARPVLPAVRPRRRVGRAVGRVAAVVGVVLTVLALTAGLVHWFGGGRGASPVAVRRPGGDPSPSRVFATPTMDWAPVLAALDAVRARAFAQGNTTLLAGVYPRGSLLSADTAMLRRLVPRGCGLVGARTRYAHMQVHETGDRVTLVADATLLPSRLVCRGRVTGHARGAGPTRLRITLVRTPAGLRIADQRAA